MTRPEVDKVEFKEGEPLKFRAIFEVLPEFELGDYKNLQVQVDEIEVGDAQVDKTIEEMRERAATFVPVEGRAAKDGDSVLIKLIGTPIGGGEPVQADNILFHWARKKRSPALRRILRGAYRRAKQSNSKRAIPTIIPIQSSREKPTTYTVEVQGDQGKEAARTERRIREGCGRRKGRSGGITTLDELRKKIRENLEAAKEQQEEAPGPRKDSRAARAAARLPGTRSADRRPDGYAAGARGAVARGAGSGSARR